MTLLSGWTSMLLAAGLTVPPLVLLYFLKLRRVAKPISSTLLWKRAAQDLQVNAPFQRIRNNLLLWLQLLILLLAAWAMGKPMIEARKSTHDTIILLVDNSASMGVVEADGLTRLDTAKKHATTVVENMPDGSRMMVIAFCDRASIASPFETDKQALMRKIDAIEQTESSTTLSEALRLAEAYLQNLVIAGDQEGQDISITSTASPAKVTILTDGNVQDARSLSVRRLPTEDMDVVSIGRRSDNVAIVSMDAKRNYERPEALEVFAMVRNFGETSVTLDANLYINGEHADVQSMILEPGRRPIESPDQPERTKADDGIERAAPPGSVASVAFDEMDYEGGGVVEVRLRIDDALPADNRAWTVIQAPRHVSVLLVTDGDIFLERLLPALPIKLTKMTPAQYEQADDDDLFAAERSLYDVVVIENHSTRRLGQGNYLFLGGVPLIEGVSAGPYIGDEVIFNWDESHPILRRVAVETIQVFQWLKLSLPPRAVTLIEGETSPVMALLSDKASQYLIVAFGFLTTDDVTGEPMLNTNWVTKTHFPMFMFNAVQYLASSMSPTGVRNVKPGEPIEFAVPNGQNSIRIRRPDGELDKIATAGASTAHYARTRKVGIYRAIPGVEDRDQRAVNLFDRRESDIATAESLTLGGDTLVATGGVRRVNKPFWPWLLLAMLVVLTVEWAVYSKRVFV